MRPPGLLLIPLFVLPASSQTWKELVDRADSLFRKGRTDSALVVCMPALDLARSAFGPVDSNVALVLHRLGGYLHMTGRSKEAEPYLQEALAIRMKVFGPIHPDVAKTMHNLALVSGAAGRLTGAEQMTMLERSISILEQSEGEDHPDVSRALNTVAAFYVTQGRLADAERLYRRGLAIRRRHLSHQDADLAESVGNLGSFYLTQDDFEKAEPLLREAVAINEIAIGWGHQTMMWNADCLARVCLEMNKYAEAETLFLRILAIGRNRGNSDTLGFAFTLNNLGSLCARQGRYDEAEQYILRSLRLRERLKGSDRWIISRNLRNLAELYFREKKYAIADSLLDRVMDILRTTTIPNLREMAETLEDHSLVLAALGRNKRAMEMADTAFVIRKRNCDDWFQVVSEQQALTYSRLLQEAAAQYMSRVFDTGPDQWNGSSRLADVIVSTKGIVSDVVLKHQHERPEPTDSLSRRITEQLRTAKFQLSGLYTHGPPEKNFDGYKSKMVTLSSKLDSLEEELWIRKGTANHHDSSHAITARQLADYVPANAALIEFMKFQYQRFDPDTTTEQYLALVLRHSAAPDVIDLGEAGNIDGLITRYRSHLARVAASGRPLSQKDQGDYDLISTGLCRLIWAPIASLVPKGGTLFISPDGGLNLISFAGLMTADSRYLIERHPIQYLSAGRDLLRLQERDSSGTGVAAFGDPDFNASIAARSGEGPDLASNVSNRPYPSAPSNVRSGCSWLNGMQVEPLHGTRAEVQSIVRYCSGEKEPPSVFFGPRATEEHFKHDCPGKRIIHIATHGYYLQGECEPGGAAGRRSLSIDRTFPEENPLLESGFFLAGANLHGTGADETGAEDGIVTALEVSAMDLKGADLVVLSACETGLGKVEHGEGMYGLTRAFQIAGARTVVSTLWKVPDEETVKFMRSLYAGMLPGPKSLTYPELMQQVALERIKELRLRGRPTHPFSWGAFVAMGDWKTE